MGVKDGFFQIKTLFPRQANTAVILTYHTISDSVYNSVSKDMFKKQMRLLRDKKFNAVSLGQLAKYRENGFIPAKTVAVTFDDGFKDNFQDAYPILKDFAIPATIFIEIKSIGRVSENQGMIFPMMRREDLKILNRSGIISLEPHSVNHPRLTKITDPEIYDEVKKSKDYLERLLEKKCYHLAYPYGLHDQRVHKIVRKAGIKYAYTTREGVVLPGTNNMMLNRNSMNREILLDQFESILLWGKITKSRLKNFFSLRDTG